MKSWDNRKGKKIDAPAFGAKKKGAVPFQGTGQSQRKHDKQEKKEDKAYMKSLPKFGKKK